MKAYKGLQQGGKLKTTGNAKVEVKAAVNAKAKVPGLPGLTGKHEATGVKKGDTKRDKGGSANGY